MPPTVRDGQLERYGQQMEEVLDDIRKFIAGQISEGFDSVHDIVENATSYALEIHDRDDLKPQIKRIAIELEAAHRKEQIEWGPSTDCDRLNEAFDSLNRQGIVARQNFSCCNNCGFTEIWDEVEKEEKTRTVEGYVFYHFQCVEHAIESGQLHMAYGSVEEDVEVLQRVAYKIIEELRRVGLNASWGGTDGHPIKVEGIVWRRRR